MPVMSADFGGRRSRRRIARWLAAIVLVLVVFWILPRVLLFYTDWLWYNYDVRYPAVFWTIFWTRVSLGAAFGIGFVVLVLINVWIARRFARHADWYVEETALRERIAEVMEFFASRYLYLVLVIFALIVGYGVAAGATDEWRGYLLFSHASPFHIKDPVFHRDVGFYIFRLPFWRYLWQWFYLAFIFVFIISAVTHYLDKAIRVLRGVPSLASHVKTHLSILLAVILAIKGIGYRIESYDLLYSTRGATFGAGYTDVNAQLLAYNILLYVALFAALITLINIFVRGIWLPVGAVGFLAVMSLVLNVVYPGLVQRYQVEPAEFTREAPYIAHTIDFTRHAYGLDAFKSHEIENVALVSPASVGANMDTIANARLWDYRPLLQTYQSLQSLQQYYAFNSVDVDRYTLNGNYRQVMISARELDLDNLPAQSRSWMNDHIFYTHGYGVVMSPVTDVVASGLPDLVVQNIPPQSSAPEVKVTRPGIYYGELTDTYVITGTKEKENDYPDIRTGATAKTVYSGKGGVPICGGLARLAASIRFQDINILISTLLTKDSKILWNRDIGSRARIVAPFLLYDSDPYIVVGADGHLYWVQDAYTTTDGYPYSEPIGTDDFALNYIRNSVKIVTDAYDGTVGYYIFDDQDPILQTYRRIFPSLFKPRSEMPTNLLDHIRYPEDLFGIQSARLTVYHMTDPRAFFNLVEKWQIGQELPKTVGPTGPGTLEIPGEGTPQAGQGEAMQAYYTIMSPPGITTPQYLLMLPFTPANKPNMVAWMSGLCDRPRYGQTIVYDFPKTEQVWGPMQIEAAIDQEPDISSRLSLWSQHGSQVVRGNLLVLPLNNTILYLEPIYLKASAQNAIPELTRIVLGRGDGKVVWGATLTEALTALLGQAPPALPVAERAKAAAPPAPAPAPAPAKPAVTPPPAPPTPAPAAPQDVRGLAQQAQRQYQDALDRQRRGDWAGYGEAVKRLQDTLNQLVKKTGG